MQDNISYSKVGFITVSIHLLIIMFLYRVIYCLENKSNVISSFYSSWNVYINRVINIQCGNN